MSARRSRAGVGIPVAAVCLAFLASASFPTEAGRAANTRPGGGGGGSAGRSSSSSSGHATRSTDSSATSRPSPAARQRVSGHATYGYRGQGGHGGYPWYPPFWDPWGYWWGAPYFSFGLWWPPVSCCGADPYEAYVDRDVDRQTPAFVETDIRPRKALVTLDGEAVGRAKDYDGRWDRLVVAPGRRTIELAADGYMTLRVRLVARAGRTIRLERELREGEGLDPRSSAEIPAETPSTIDAAEPRGDHEPSGLGRGFLKIDVAPADAAVYLDGEFLASAGELAGLHGAIAVAEGEHRIEAVHPSFERRAAQVQVAMKETVRVELRLDVGVGDR